MYQNHPVFGSLQRKHYLDILGEALQRGMPLHCTLGFWQQVIQQKLLWRFDTSIDLKMTVKHLLLSYFQIPRAPSKIPAYCPSQFSQKDWFGRNGQLVTLKGLMGFENDLNGNFFPPSFSYQNWCQIYIRIFSYYQAPETYSGAVK